MREVYRDIIKSMCDCDMNISEAARSIYMSRNGVLHQLDNIINDYNLDPRKFHDLIILEKMANGEIEDTCKRLYCLRCGKELEGLRSKFCSDECARKYWNAKNYKRKKSK